MKKKVFFVVFTMILAFAFFSCTSTSSQSTGSQSRVEIPKTAEDYYQEAMDYANDKEDYVNALNSINEAIRLNPDELGYLNTRGQILYLAANTRDEYNNAIREFESFIAKDPQRGKTTAYSYLAACYLYIGDYSTARLNADKALELTPDYDFALRIITRINELVAEQEAAALKVAELQRTLDEQFRPINKADYQVMDNDELQGAAMMLMFGMGSPFQRGGKYKAVANMAVNSQYGATFTVGGLIGLADRNYRISPELLSFDINSVNYYIYFTVNSISGADHFITVEYIELIQK